MGVDVVGRWNYTRRHTAVSAALAAALASALAAALAADGLAGQRGGVRFMGCLFLFCCLDALFFVFSRVGWVASPVPLR